jgi:hypothetical protein
MRGRLRHRPPGADAVLEWLSGNCWLFGFAGQNWMLVVAGGLTAYIAGLAYVRRRRRPDAAAPWPRRGP